MVQDFVHEPNEWHNSFADESCNSFGSVWVRHVFEKSSLTKINFMKHGKHCIKFFVFLPSRLFAAIGSRAAVLLGSFQALGRHWHLLSDNDDGWGKGLFLIPNLGDTLTTRTHLAFHFKNLQNDYILHVKKCHPPSLLLTTATATRVIFNLRLQRRKKGRISVVAWQ